MNRLIFSLVMACGLLAGCASTGQSLSQEDRSKLTTVHVSDKIAKPAKMYWLGSGGIGFAFGAIGGAITAEANKSPGEQFQQYVESKNVVIENIVREEAISALRDSGKMTLTEGAAPAAATLNISITQYGFSIPTGFSSKVVPVLAVKCSLVDASGKTIWEANDRIHPLGNPVEAKTPDELGNDPKLVEASWRAAAKAAMVEIAKKL